MKEKKRFAAAALFLLFIFGMFFYLLRDFNSISGEVLHFYQKNRSENPTIWEKASLCISKTESAVNDSADRSHGFIELFGGVQRLLSKRVIDDYDPENIVVRLSNGTLQLIAKGASEQDMTGAAASLSRLHQTLAKSNIPLLYINAPEKIQEGAKVLPTGIYEYGNAQADALLQKLKAQSVPALDLRGSFSQANYGANFFVTDHHWKPEAAFTAFQTICGTLRTQYGFSIPSAVTDFENYSVLSYHNYFLGSQGKRVGTLYAGTDDISLIAPRFKTSLVYDVASHGIHRAGDYLNTVIFRERVKEKDYFGGNPYTMYAGGDYALGRIVNNDNAGGPKILMVRDSFAGAITPFLSLACSKLETLDLRYFTGSLTQYILETKPDIVLYLYTASSTSNQTLFKVN
ncbi:MAG: DHHW family protein [Oscillospiraceae bacterium]|nr:DHHW family protein [Oscillospiraceae bacterium]